LESSERLFKAVQAALKSSGLAPERLELKITESSLLSSAPHVVEMLPRLRACGVRIAMDEFGIGHPSMSRFRSFPFNKIKADRDFIARLGIGADAAAEIRAIAALAAGYGMASIAESNEPADKTVLAGADGSSDTQGDPPSLPIHAVEIDALLRRYVPAPTSVSTTE
jgi:EAL domain-containing protein (putative c-di-GMP-specific phosphodiesterase class I)